jgi:recombinational DNA repair protein (RecF pathway)
MQTSARISRCSRVVVYQSAIRKSLREAYNNNKLNELIRKGKEEEEEKQDESNI